MVESVRGRNKEQRARLLLGYQVADSVSKLHPLIHPRIWYLSSMGRKILWLNVNSLSKTNFLLWPSLVLAFISVLNIVGSICQPVNVGLRLSSILSSLPTLRVQRHERNVLPVENLLGRAHVIVIVSNPRRRSRMGGAGYREHWRPVQVGVRVAGSSRGEVARESGEQMKRGKTEKWFYAK